MRAEDYIREAIRTGKAAPGSLAGDLLGLKVAAPSLPTIRADSSTGAVGGYVGGGMRETLAMWQPAGSDANYATVPDLRMLRNRSRDLVRNSPIGAGAIETTVSHVIGSGLSLQSHIDAEFLGMDDDEADAWQREAERLFTMWADSDLSDCYGVQTFAETQDLAVRSSLESGDSFVVLTTQPREGWPFRLALQVIEADRIANEGWRADNDTFVQGIEHDEQKRPIAAWVMNRHPGAAYSTQGFKWERVPYRSGSRRNVLHLYRKLRPGQTRGVPVLAPIIESVKQLTRYSTAEVDAAVNSAVWAVFTKMDPDTFQDLFDDSGRADYVDARSRWDGTMRSGAAVNLLPGEDITSPTPGRPNPNFGPFIDAVFGQIGMALNLPKEVLLKQFNSSYSASRAALLDAWRTFKIRRAWVASKLCQPVYEEWLADAVALGLISAPGFFADPQIRKAWSGAMWGGDGMGSLDPKKEAEAVDLRVKMGLTTLPEEIVSYDGGDWENKHRVSARVKAERVEAGLEAPVALPPGSPGAANARTEPPEEPADPADIADDGAEDGAEEQTGMMRARIRARLMRMNAR